MDNDDFNEDELLRSDNEGDFEMLHHPDAQRPVSRSSGSSVIVLDLPEEVDENGRFRGPLRREGEGASSQADDESGLEDADEGENSHEDASMDDESPAREPTPPPARAPTPPRSRRVSTASEDSIEEVDMRTPQQKERDRRNKARDEWYDKHGFDCSSDEEDPYSPLWAHEALVTDIFNQHPELRTAFIQAHDRLIERTRRRPCKFPGERCVGKVERVTCTPRMKTLKTWLYHSPSTSECATQADLAPATPPAPTVQDAAVQAQESQPMRFDQASQTEHVRGVDRATQTGALDLSSAPVLTQASTSRDAGLENTPVAGCSTAGPSRSPGEHSTPVTREAVTTSDEEAELTAFCERSWTKERKERQRRQEELERHHQSVRETIAEVEARRPASLGPPGPLPKPGERWNPDYEAAARKPCVPSTSAKPTDRPPRQRDRSPLCGSYVVNGEQVYTLPPLDGCWNCGQGRHRYSECVRQIGLRQPFCYRCGTRGVRVNTCPRCSYGWEKEGPYVSSRGQNVPRHLSLHSFDKRSDPNRFA